MSKLELEVQITSDRLSDGPADSSARNVHNNLLTLKEVQTIIKQAIGNETAKVQKFFLKSYSDGKLGFLGSHQKLCVEVKTPSETKILSFFLKAIPYDVPTQAEYVLDKCVFLKERIFYRDIVPQLYDEHCNEAWTAACYLIREDLLVFEDLSAKGFSMRSKQFDKELVLSSLSAIARMHASSLLTEARLGKSLKDIYPQAFVQNAFLESGKTRTWFDVSVKAIIAIADHLGLDSSLISKACEEVFSAMDTSSTKRNVISHGDLWANNLMFNNSIPPTCLLVDFQLLRYCPIAHDVIQLLYLCTDRDFRATWEESVLKYYYSVLCETIKSARPLSVDVPSWSELIDGMEEQRLGALITAAVYFQTVLLDEKTAAEVLHDTDSYHEFEFINRNEIVLRIMESDPTYRKMLTEVITELVNYSFRLDELPKPT